MLDSNPTFESAEWISPGDPAAHHDDGASAVWTLGRTFELDRVPETASLTVTADGLYEIFLNGERVGDAELAPGSTPYQAILDVQRYEVTAQLRTGRNVIHALLSDGWFRGNNGTWRRRGVWGDELALIAELRIGERLVVTDGDWGSRRSSIVRADLIDGQTTDLRLDDWSQRDLQAVTVVDHDRARLRWSPAPPVRRVAELVPRSIARLSAERQIVDLGQNFSGWARVSGLGAAGNEVTLEFAEHLGPDGDISTEHLDSRAEQLGRHIPFHQIDVAISGGPGRDVFEPRHTVHGFRYIRVDGYPRDLRAEDITGVVVNSDLARIGSFRSSSADLDRLHEAARWSFISNAVDVPTDCPTRERSGWTGDFQLFAQTAAYLYDIDGFARRWLRSLAADQRTDGRVPNITPNNEHRPDPSNPYSQHMHGSAGWADAAVHVPWVLYTTYGDAQVLHDQWPSIRGWVSFQEEASRTQRHSSRVERSAEPAPHEAFLWDAGFHWGEWNEGPQHERDGSLRPDPGMMHRMTMDQGELATGYFYRSVRTAAAIAAVIGETEEARRLAELAEHIRDAWQTEFLLADGRTVADTQAGYVRAIAFGLYPERSVADGVRHLVDLIHGAGGRAETGFLSTPFLLPVLADHGHPELAYSILLNHEPPSWLAMIDRGATTLWEEWDGVDARGEASASLNHYSRGAVVEFFYSHILGIRPWPRSSPGFDEVLIQPVPGGGLEEAHGAFVARSGSIGVDWTRRDGRFELRVVIPERMRATVVLPSGASAAVTGGTHHFSEI